MSARKRLALDIALTVGLLAAFNPARTGIPVHQWLSIALLAPVLLHLLVNWQWALRVARTFMARLLSVSRLNFVVDVALFAASVTVMVSGFMVAPALLAPVGIHFTATYAWHLVHAWSADATVVLFALHGALHWRWALGVVKRLASNPKVSAAAGSPARPAVVAAAAGRSATKPAARARRDRAAQAAKERAAFVRGVSLIGVTAAAATGVVLAVAVAGPLLVQRSAAARVALAAKSGAAAQNICPATGCTTAKCHGASGAKAATFYTKAQIAAGMKASKGRPAAAKVASAAKHGKWTAPAAGIHVTRLPRPNGEVTLLSPPKPKRTASPAGTPGSGGRAVASSGSSSSVASNSSSSSSSSPKKSVASAGTQTCPRTGCTASGCHGAHGVSAAAYYH
jgi:hypothetical protein